MVLVKMLKTKDGAPHGHTVFTYDEGKVYPLPEELADAFIKDGVAALSNEEGEIENKALTGGEETKPAKKPKK